MNRLDGKVALISGAAGAIGAATARLMAEAGASVVLGDILDDSGRDAARAIEDAGGKASYVHLDVTDEQGWTAAIESAVARFGGLDILVNNAGIYIAKDLEQSTLADWRRICDVNLTGVFLGTRAALPALRARGAHSPHGSAIVNLSSIAGLVGSSFAPLYSLTKGALTTFTKSMALEFGRKGDRIRINSIHPGMIENEMGEQVLAALARHAGHDDVAAARAKASAAYPMKRLGTVIDVAKGIVYLASDDAGFVTGSGLTVDGGWTAQ